MGNSSLDMNQRGAVALGEQIELSRLTLPVYLLAGSDDDVVSQEQLLAVERLVGTRPEHLRREVTPCNHLGLFIGYCWSLSRRFLILPETQDIGNQVIRLGARNHEVRHIPVV